MPNKLSLSQKKEIAKQSLAGHRATHLAKNHHVSRNTVYQCKAEAEKAIDQVFSSNEGGDKVLFHVNVTKDHLEQLVLGLVLVCKSSYRGAQLLLSDILDTPISLGTVHNICDKAAQKAELINDNYNLEPIKQSASDEIFHRGKPVLAVVDLESKFCARLSAEQYRDSDTWRINLMYMDNQKFKPELNISDMAKGMMHAFAEEMKETKHYFDHFHIIQSMNKKVLSLKHQKKSAGSDYLKLIEKMGKAKKKNKGHQLSKKLSQAKEKMTELRGLYNQVSTLCSWMQYDILQLPGHPPKVREELFDFVLEELQKTDCKQAKSLAISISHQKEHLLAVAWKLNGHFEGLANKYNVSTEEVWGLCYAARYDLQSPKYYEHTEHLMLKLGDKVCTLEDEMLLFMEQTPRCSSAVENYNSRLRPYLDPKKQVTQERLHLIKFYLNHQVFLRSKHAHLKGKSPAAALTSKPHSNWLEMLGYKPFKRAKLAA